jgi:hypothetical protein
LLNSPAEHGTIRTVPIVLLLAAAGIVAGVALAARGRAGEMAMFLPDAALFQAGEMTTPDVALLRPPLSLWGYNAAATDEALQVIARAMAARDVEIATLRRALDAQAGSAGQPSQAGQAGPGAWRRPEESAGE